MVPLGQPTSRKYSHVPAPLSWDAKPAVWGGEGERVALLALARGLLIGKQVLQINSSLADRVNTLFKVLKLLPGRTAILAVLYNQEWACQETRLHTRTIRRLSPSLFK